MYEKYDEEMYLNYHEFYELLWDRVPQELVSNMYIDENQDFVRDLIYNLYSNYEDDRITLNLAASIVQMFFKSLFLHKPDLSNIVDNKWI